MTIIHHVGACGLPHRDSYRTIWHISWPEEQIVDSSMVVAFARLLETDVLYPAFSRTAMLVMSRVDQSPTEAEVRHAANEAGIDTFSWTFIVGHVLFNPLRRNMGMND